MECLSITSIRHIIGLQWNLKVQDILPYLTSDENNTLQDSEKVIRCIQCRIKGMDGFMFSLELTNQLNVHAKVQSGWSYHIVYAFAVLQDRAFLVKENDNLIFLDMLGREHLESVEEVAFHCLVQVGTPVADSTLVLPNLADNNFEKPAEVRMCTNLQCIEHSHCTFDGHIPEFTVDKAKELISKKDINCVLKVLAMEYLMTNIQADNVSDILKISVDQDLKALAKQCSLFLRMCIIRLPPISSSSDSSSDSFSTQ